MFNFNKKNEDPKGAMDKTQQGIDKLNSTLNNGLMGGLTKAFMGKDFVNTANSALGDAQNAIDGIQSGQMVAQTGLEAAAEVTAIQDTGATVNDNPVVMLSVKATTMMGTQFDTTGRVMVSRLAIPRVGDKIKIKYNPVDPTQIAIV